MGAGAELFVSHEYAVYFECAVEIEELMIELKERFTIAIVTHDLQ